MKTSIVSTFAITLFYVFGLQSYCNSNAQSGSIVSGFVFHDVNGNGLFDLNQDIPLKEIAVSNGRDVVLTDQNGQYQLPLRDNSAIFVIKPRNWIVSVDKNQLPEFYYFFSSEGASGNDFDGLPPTGPLTGPVNFPLYPADEPDNFDVLVFGDTQVRNESEIYYMANDALSELSGINAAFGVTLGDVVFDDLNLYDHLIGSIATLGIPWRYIPGNHDIDFSADNNNDARGAWYRTFGPSYYSFSHGPAHFIVLDNIRWIVEGNHRFYRTGLGEDQMEFLRNELGRLDRDQLVVLLAHIPWAGASPLWHDESEQHRFFELIAGHPNSVSLVSHAHRHFHHFIDEEYGFPGDKPHHMVVVGTVCGSWYSGAPDEYGIPHAMMADGTPSSYAFLHIDGNQWKMSWKATRRPEDFQMHISAPDVVKSDEKTSVTITAKVFNALPDAAVKIKIMGTGQWIDMVRKPGIDPVRQALVDRESLLDEVPWRRHRNIQVSVQLWVAELDISMDPGVYLLKVKAEDDWWNYEGSRLLHVR